MPRANVPSKIILDLSPIGSVTPSNAGPASVGRASALDQLDPGMRMNWDVAPAARMALTAACTDVTHVGIDGTSCGSFMMPN